MKTIEDIRAQMREGRLDFSEHASRRSTSRNIDRREIVQAGINAVIIEEYPDDKYGPSCLLLGFTETGRPLHVLVSVAEEPLLKIITCYEPDEDEWTDLQTRRQ